MQRCGPRTLQSVAQPLQARDKPMIRFRESAAIVADMGSEILCFVSSETWNDRMPDLSD